MAKELYNLGEMPPLGEVPPKMHAWLIRPERFGKPLEAFQKEVVNTPPIADDEVLVLVKAAGINYNNVWAGPVSYTHLYMSVTYFFNPEVIGISPSKGNTWETNDWNRNNISQYPQKEQFAEKLVEWGNQMPPLILYGFNREGTEPQSIPKPPF